MIIQRYIKLYVCSYHTCIILDKIFKTLHKVEHFKRERTFTVIVTMQRVPEAAVKAIRETKGKYNT